MLATNQSLFGILFRFQSKLKTKNRIESEEKYGRDTYRVRIFFRFFSVSV